MSKVPARFYVYLRLDAFGLKKLIALLNEEAPLTKVWRFNDPFDSQRSFDHSGSIPRFRDEESEAIMNGHISVKGMKKAKNKTFESRVINERAVFCVCEQWDSKLMWSHYADLHKGICVELRFDSQRLPADCDFERVRYSTHYSMPRAAHINEREELLSLFLTKSADWIYEKEWRLIAPVGNYSDNMGTFDGLIPKSPFSVERILCGVKCENSRDIRDLFEGAGSPRAKALLNDEVCEKVASLQLQSFDGNVTGAYVSLLDFVKDFEVDEKVDSVEIVRAKEEIISTAIFQVLNYHPMNLIKLEKSGSEFSVVLP